MFCANRGHVEQVVDGERCVVGVLGFRVLWFWDFSFLGRVLCELRSR